jgi:hypothetical protein
MACGNMAPPRVVAAVHHVALVFGGAKGRALYVASPRGGGCGVCCGSAIESTLRRLGLVRCHFSLHGDGR